MCTRRMDMQAHSSQLVQRLRPRIETPPKCQRSTVKNRTDLPPKAAQKHRPKKSITKTSPAHYMSTPPPTPPRHHQNITPRPPKHHRGWAGPWIRRRPAVKRCTSPSYRYWGCRWELGMESSQKKNKLDQYAVLVRLIGHQAEGKCSADFGQDVCKDFPVSTMEIRHLQKSCPSYPLC